MCKSLIPVQVSMEWKTLQEAILASYYIVSSDKKWEGDDILPVNYPSSKKGRKNRTAFIIDFTANNQPTSHKPAGLYIITI